MITLIFTAFALSLSQVFEEEGLFMWARSTELARFPRSRLAALFFGKKSIASNEKPGCLGYRNLGLCDRDLGNGDENFSKRQFSPGDRDETIFDKIASLSQQQWQKWHNFWLVCFSTAELVVKLKQSTKPYNRGKRSTILVLFLELHAARSTGRNFSSEQTTFISVAEQPGCRAHNTSKRENTMSLFLSLIYQKKRETACFGRPTGSEAFWRWP